MRMIIGDPDSYRDHVTNEKQIINTWKVPERFKVRFLEEASEFIDSIDEKAREKIIYNIKKAQVINNPKKT